MAVFDASVVAALFLDRPWSIEVRRWLAEDDDPISPAFLLIELANVLWINRRAGAIADNDAAQALRDVPAAIRLEQDELLVEPALRLAVSANHPIYDCLYLALAERDRVPLITADRKLSDISKARGLATLLLPAPG